MNCSLRRIAAACALVGLTGASMAGPVILGGDDLTEHGSRSAGGANLAGWLYIEKAVSNVLGGVTRAGAITTDIVALGSTFAGFTSGNAGGAIGSVANVLGKTITYVDGFANINQFFLDLAAGVINPKMLWLAGTGAANDLDAAEGTALTNNAAAINGFGSSGGGIMSHGSGADAYGWLSALLPGLSEIGECQASGATLTAAGNAAFPGLTNNNVAAGPCHSSFIGNFGGLTTLAFDGLGRSFILGGGAGTIIQCGQTGQPPCNTNNVPEPSSLMLFGIAGLGLASLMRRRQIKPGTSTV